MALTLDTKDLVVELNCEHGICKCARSANFKVSTLERQLKQYQIIDTALLACAYHQLGVINHYNEKYEKAILHYEEAIRLRERFNDGWLWKSQLNLASSFFLNNQNKQSLAYLEKSLNQAGHPRRPQDSIMLFHLFASVYKEIGELDNALQFAKKATTVNAIPKRIIRAQINYVDVLVSTYDSTNLRNGISILDSLVKMDDQSVRNLIFINNIYGNAYSYLTDFKKSTHYYTKALQLLEDEATKAILAANIATVFTEQNKLEMALEFLDLSSQLNKAYYEDKYNYVYAANHENFGDYYSKSNKIDSALHHYQKALINLTNNFRTEDIYQNPNPNDTTLFLYSNPDMIRVLHLKATAAYQYYQQNKDTKYLNLANQTYQTAFDFHDKLQKDISTENSRLFQAKNIVPYIENALKVAYQQQKNGEDVSETAFRFMEKNKATVLLQSMNEADALQFANLPDSLLEQEKDLKIAITFYKLQRYETEDTIELNQIDTQLFELQQQYQKLINTLEQNHPTYYQLKYQQNETTLDMVQDLLNESTAVVEYFVGEDDIHTLLIQKDKAQLFQFNKPENLQKTIDNFQLSLSLKDTIQNPQLDRQFVESAHQLYQWLIEKPEAVSSEAIASLLIIPDGNLNYIPFGALLTDSFIQSENINYKNLPYLLKQKAIGYAYSGALWVEQHLQENLNSKEINYAGFAPTYGKDSGQRDLPFAEQSVKDNAQLFGGISFLKKEASRQQFEKVAHQFNVLQLAMHVLLNDEQPMQTKLLFSQTQKDSDTELAATNLYNMELQADLAVLDACNTGSGQLQNGEGVMSLSRAFTYAGCSSLVTSLWSVQDESTANIVNRFFKNLQQGKPKHVALQQAKLNFMEEAFTENAHPSHWAGLIVSGNQGAIKQQNNSLIWVLAGMIILITGCWFLRTS